VLCSVTVAYLIYLIYFAFVHSHLLYGIEICGNVGTSQLDKLLKLNNKLMRILQKKTCILK